MRRNKLIVPIFCIATSWAIPIVSLVSCKNDDSVKPTPQSSFEWKTGWLDPWHIYGVTITKFIGKEKQINIPSVFISKDGVELPVIEIGEEAFYENKMITKLILPNSIKKVGERAFYHCENLKSAITYGNLGKDCFYSCFNLSSVRMFGNHSSDSGIFQFDNKISYVEFGDGTSVLCGFLGRELLKSVLISNSIEDIENQTFNSCHNLKSIKYNGTVDDWTNIPKPEQFADRIGTDKVWCIKSKAYCGIWDERKISL